MDVHDNSLSTAPSRLPTTGDRVWFWWSPSPGLLSAPLLCLPAVVHACSDDGLVVSLVAEMDPDVMCEAEGRLPLHLVVRRASYHASGKRHETWSWPDGGRPMSLVTPPRVMA